MTRRLYPFSAPTSNTTSGSTAKVTMTWMKPNPFHGWRRWAFAFDEFNHRHGLNTRGPLRWFCVWWDRYLMPDDDLPGVHW